MNKNANINFPINQWIIKRWSPYRFSSKPIAAHDIAALFEAARWAPSSYNEQPWRYIIATQDQAESFARLLTCLAETNQAWAKNAYLLALGTVDTLFSRNSKLNKSAQHDLGLASANLCFEATSRSLFVHQMAGILPDKARELYQIPQQFDICTALAIGYLDDTQNSNDAFSERDNNPRQRKPIKDFVFSNTWDQSSDII